MVSSYPRRAIGIFPDYRSAEMALRELQTSGFPMNRVSLIGRDVSRLDWLNRLNVHDRFDFRATFPQERAAYYENRLSQGYYLVIVEGTQDEIGHAEAILNRNSIQDWGIYNRAPEQHSPVRGVDRHRRALGVFPHRRDAEHALHELRDSGFPMNRVSVIKRDAARDDQIAGTDVRDHVENKADEGAAVGALSGGVLGGLTGLLVGLGTLAIPGIGPIMLAGATATTIATTLAGTAIGAAAGGLLGALIGLGIPEERARVYHERVARGDYLVIAEGTDEELARAEAILRHRGIEEYGVYDMPDAETVPAHHATHTAPSPVVNHTSHTGWGRNRSAVGFFSHLRDAEIAIADLRSAGFPMSQVSLIGRHFDRQEQFPGVDLRDRFDAMRLGLPDDRARFYNDQVARGDYVVIVNGSEDDIRHAASILSHRGIQEWQIYDPSVIETGHSVHYTAPAHPAVSGVSVGRDRQAVGLFNHLRDAEMAITDLTNAGFPMSQVTLVGRHFERRDQFPGVDVRDRFERDRFSFPEERINFFHDRLNRGDYLVIVTGTDDEIHRAEAILHRWRIQDWGAYDVHPVESVGTEYKHLDEHPVAGVETTSTDHPTPGVSSHPEVIIIDRREQIL